MIDEAAGCLLVNCYRDSRPRRQGPSEGGFDQTDPLEVFFQIGFKFAPLHRLGIADSESGKCQCRVTDPAGDSELSASRFETGLHHASGLLSAQQCQLLKQVM